MNKTGFISIFCIFLFLFMSSAVFAAGLVETTSVAMENMANILSQNLNSSQTFGNPIHAGDYIVIPVIAKGVIFGLGSKIEDAGQNYKDADDTNKSGKKEKNHISLGAAGFSRPVALIFISKTGDFKVVKMNEGVVAQLAKYIVPQIPKFVKEVIDYKNKIMKKHMKKMHGKKGIKKQKKRKHRKNQDKEIRIRIEKDAVH